MSADLSYNGLALVLNNHRAADIAESQALLLELGSSEPTLQQCFEVIESTCLSQGIKCHVRGSKCSARFQKHLDMHCMPFLKEALLVMVVFRFVQWLLRKLRSGNQVPEILPSGTFDWHT